MPATIKMTLSNGNTNYYRSQISASSTYGANISSIPKSAPVTAAVNAPLSSSMIGRIHTTKPGCGSCGRK